MYIIKKGLDIPISGHASGEFEIIETQQAAVLGPDYVGMKPTMLVQVGDTVKCGQKLFEDKKNPGVFFTSPMAGKVSAIHRGAKRALLSVVIDKAGDDAEMFQQLKDSELTREAVVSNLVDSGLWTSFRTRPYSKIPAVGAVPHSIFVTAIDSNPLAVDPDKVITDAPADFELGLKAVSLLTEGKTYVCQRVGSDISVGDAAVEVAEFDGPHPSGLVGTHIHTLDPVNVNKSVWHLNYQDVIAIGRLFRGGKLDTTRVISIAGPAAKFPKFAKTILGASLTELLTDQGVDDSVRVINGSVLNGAFVQAETAFLGKYVLQISLLEEGDKKEFIGWLLPGSDKFTATKAYLGGITKKIQALTTSSGGSPRSMVPIGVYEKVMPLDILPTLLLKAIIIRDTDEAQRLGVLELDEEDLALCTFVCPSKYEYGAILRENLEKIEKEG
ncbi:MAG: NADH:ubiquinone reductase (Na(+)-transporting) subunit A [Gammaproteobacteria bacterium]|nr:MAG: NADH:ubiquinone reductase (Na(+)-transporting) subunit A [Gammaproteobacteria bacterium]